MVNKTSEQRRGFSVNKSHMKSKPTFTKAEAEKIIALITEKLKSDTTKQKAIRQKIRNIGFYASEYGFTDGYTVQQFLSVAKIAGGDPIKKATEPIKKTAIDPLLANPVHKVLKEPNTITKARSQSDESYVIDLCDEILKQKALRQHRFDFLTGDAGTRLPVDAYYPSLNLVIEFRERQHSEKVKFFDRRQTVSGMGRGEQRKLYDQRRRDTLPKHGIKLIELGYDDFEHTSGKKLVRNREKDLKVITKKMK
jgi:hypothetical protein